MDFFGQQEAAKRNTGWLVALFAIAVVLIVATVYLAALVALRGAEMTAGNGWWDPVLLALVAGGVGLTVGVASGVRTLTLRSGGSAVAELMGGRIVSPETSDEDERRLRNIVEEMALASGVPVPVVYVLPDEPGINAFAAGYGIDDAVVAVTDGALHSLARDELQGVVAHEFSHLLNRDSRLNIQLTGLIFGILALGLAGRLLLRGSLHVRGGKKNQGAVVMIAVGLALFLAGYFGVLCGRMIRAAVSRQREFLADAAAVQFTRNPQGLAGALKKIGTAGSALQNPSSEEVSHFFFASGMRPTFLNRLWATHPPLTERIRRLDPAFDGTVSEGSMTSAEGPSAAVGLRGEAVSSANQTLAPPAVGATVLDGLPDVLHEAAGSSFGAVAMVYALVLDPEPAVRTKQMDMLAETLQAPLHREVMRLLPSVDALSPEARLPLVDVAAPALRQLSPPQASAFSGILAALARVDGHLSIFEFALETIVQHRLSAVLGQHPRRGAKLDEVLPDAIVLLSALAHVGASVTDEVGAAFGAGLRSLTDTAYRPAAATSRDLEGVLDRIGHAGAATRARIVEACVRTVLHDRAVTREEGQVLRAIAIALDAPLPSFLPRLDALSPAA